MYPWIVFFLFFIDIFSKIIAEKKLKFHPKSILDGAIHFYYVRNFGIAFNKLSHKKWLILTLNFVLLIYITSLYTAPNINKMGLSLVLAGGLGNTLNRLFRGYVIDFIYFNIKGSPVFNMADFYILSGIIVILLEEVIII
ncbi:signal peptidase II [uncultured Ilyobacter sp.]|uniref:signal peptidase II n=1 Tax=uncultured Ilyobacter sp. TaxID=544433 RepID=UPI0029F46ABA|nr:signal peptidase II [uncultured Ilyobacter sp.]